MAGHPNPGSHGPGSRDFQGGSQAFGASAGHDGGNPQQRDSPRAGGAGGQGQGQSRGGSQQGGSQHGGSQFGGSQHDSPRGRSGGLSNQSSGSLPNRGRPEQPLDAENKSFVLQKRHQVTFENRPVPELKTGRYVLVQVLCTGICGSDVHYWHEGKIGPFVLEKPMVLGHESAGIVVRKGPDVTSVEIGDKVAMEPGVHCRYCERCKEGNYNLCPDMAFAATPPYDGTLANYYALPEDMLKVLPPNMSLEEGALMEPAAVGVHLVRQADVKQGDSVVVFGAGPVGLLCMGVARAYGASKIVAVDLNTARLREALSFAATHTYESKRVPPQENAENIRRQCQLGLGADIVIDASGAEPAIQAGIHLCRPGASYVQGGMGKDDVVFPIMAACTKELRVMGSFRYSEGDYRTAIKMASSGELPVKQLITKKWAFEQAEEAFKKTQSGEGMKYLIAGPSQSVNGSGNGGNGGGQRGGSAGRGGRGVGGPGGMSGRGQGQGQGGRNESPRGAPQQRGPPGERGPSGSPPRRGR